MDRFKRGNNEVRETQGRDSHSNCMSDRFQTPGVARLASNLTPTHMFTFRRRNEGQQIGKDKKASPGQAQSQTMMRLYKPAAPNTSNGPLQARRQRATFCNSGITQFGGGTWG